MPTVSRRVLANAIATRLLTVTNATGYYGRVGRLLPGAPAGTPLDPPPKSPTDPRVKPYFVLYPGAGTDGPDPDLADCAHDLTQLVQVTAAAGDIEDLLALIDRLDAALNRWAPTIPGVVCGRLKPPVGFVPPPVLVDRDENPHRLFVPLQYQLTATT